MKIVQLCLYEDLVIWGRNFKIRSISISYGAHYPIAKNMLDRRWPIKLAQMLAQTVGCSLTASLGKFYPTLTQRIANGHLNYFLPNFGQTHTIMMQKV